jgi:DNA-binding NarL/FixJ family response regulator
VPARPAGSGATVATVVICTGQRLVRESLRRVVAGIPGVDRVDVTATAHAMLSRWPAAVDDLVLLDLWLPDGDGVQVLQRLLRRDPRHRVVMLAGPADRDPVARAVAAGAAGYLAKNATREEVCAVLLAALTGPRSPVRARVGGPPPPDLTERERQVLFGMAHGQSNGQIGRSLYLSEDTVKTHARRLFRKLGVNDRAQAVARGFRWGFVR